MAEPLTPDQFQHATNVSRETLDRLKVYVDLLRRWNSRINLVGQASLGDVWRRHILDSAQLAPFCPPSAKVLVDLGSGAGLPGMILGILRGSGDQKSAIHLPAIHLIESDQRKCAFLREVARITETKVTIHAERVEKLTAFAADIITARALAPMTQLLAWSERFFIKSKSICLFLKGESLDRELTKARLQWIIETQVIVSRTDETGHILKLEGLNRAPKLS